MTNEVSSSNVAAPVSFAVHFLNFENKNSGYETFFIKTIVCVPFFARQKYSSLLAKFEKPNKRDTKNLNAIN